MKKLIISIALTASVGILSAQNYHDYGFAKEVSIAVLRSDSTVYRHAWAGGMNNIQFGWVDCNLDGKKDLVAFEVQGNRILPFLWQDTAYVYAPQYAVCFPQMQGFMQLVDFDGDGKEDIFTFNIAGIKVYRNVSDTVLKFELFTEMILSLHGSGQTPTNLFCTPGDYVVIQDLDGDGDVDILAFGSLGKYVYYHKNMSMERYGDSNHLEFMVVDECWGKFAENGESNDITLNVNCWGTSSKTHRHAGSSMLAFDENGNGLFDLLLGDTGFPNLFLLTNGGSSDSAHIIAKDTLFPSYDTPVHLYSMPCPMLIDADKDGLPDLLVSPFDLALTKSENKESVWFYKNTNTVQQPVFELQTKSFLQNEMLDFGSGAFPLFYDADEDGLTDILVGNYGYYDSTTFDGFNFVCHYSAAIAFYKNVGTATQPQFLLITEDLGGLRNKGFLSLTPAMGDLNGDGKPDMLISTSTGELIYLENNSVDGNLSFANPVFNYKSLILNDFAAIQLFDLDKDGLLDLIVGNKSGFFQFYKNAGTLTNPNFVLQKDTLGGIIVRDYDVSYWGYATPCFFR
ncbi:MAG: VCBS repeat-containing protein, partial [Lentimicrobiaceae bacterium]|nr:VCBS repeat-containing protein [Lentimicrobiaceae bacterium]